MVSPLLEAHLSVKNLQTAYKMKDTTVALVSSY